MEVIIETGNSWRAFEKDMGAMGRAVFMVMSEGLKDGAADVAGHIQENYLSGQALRSRSGMLHKRVTSWMVNAVTAAIGIPDTRVVGAYAWLLTDEEKTIRPKRGKYLAIPIEEGLKKSGMPKYDSPRDAPDGFFFRSGGQLFMGRRNGKKGRLRLLFVFKRQVTIKGRNVLVNATNDKVDAIGEKIQKAIDAVIS